ncbi:MAG TPA: diacylglycerol kinase family protein [Gammaproteobacteria bacterium]|nr:diacylglycerol kinase family protein [Gammaproteobacteria bacterium]
MDEPWQLIFNPVAGAGAGRAARARAAVIGHLRALGIEFEDHDTEGPGHAAMLSREAWRAGRKRFLIAGGDGTVSEVINGIFDGGVPDTQPVVAAIPLGSGNDWVRSRGAEVGVARIVEKLAAPSYRECPVGVVRGVDGDQEWQRYFANSAGIGLDVCVLRQLPRWRVAAARYAVGLVRAFGTFEAREACLIADGEARRGVSLLNLCALGAYTGGGMCLAPHASAAPRELAVTWVADVSWRRLALSGRKIYNGTLGERPEVALYHAKKVEFVAPVGEPLQIDGEIIGVTPAVVEIFPAAVLTLAGQL